MMAAAVLSSCPSRSRRSQSQDNPDRVTLGQERHKGETDKFVLDMLSQLPPSRELLQHYQVMNIVNRNMRIVLSPFKIPGEIREI